LLDRVDQSEVAKQLFEIVWCVGFGRHLDGYGLYRTVLWLRL
jgi:hypothetical protein